MKSATGGAPRFHKPALMINAASGSASDIREAARALFAEHGMELRAEHLQPDEIADTVDDIFSDGCDLFVSFGGDGTSRASGERCAKEDVAFVPLPGGTMNMLPKLLYGDVGWEQALRAALVSEVRWHPRGEAVVAGGKAVSFFCGGYLGQVTRVNEAREELRDGGVGEAVGKLGEVVSDVDLRHRLRFGPPEAPRAHVANVVDLQMPGMSERVPYQGEGGNFFDIAGAEVEGALDVARLGLLAATGDWKADASAVSLLLREAVIDQVDDCPHALWDGEPTDMDCPITVRLIERGVRVLAPDLAPGTVRAP